jgi:hypothetical protein
LGRNVAQLVPNSREPDQAERICAERAVIAYRRPLAGGIQMSRNEYIAAEFNKWLSRYAPPRFVAENPDAAQNEADALMRIIGRYAPTNGYVEWLEGVLRCLTEGMTARTWPTGGEVSKACRDANRFEKPRETVLEDWRDGAQIVARAMSSGQPVGEHWLYGVLACELIARNLVTRETMEAYRSGAFLKRRSVYGERAALDWEAEAKAAHEHGKVLWRSRNDARTPRNTVDQMPRSQR